jgi:para-nitrobenzyl esterase
MNVFTPRVARIVLTFAFASTVGCSSSSSNPATAPVSTDAGGAVDASLTDAGPGEGGMSSGALDVMTDKGMVHGASSMGVRSFLGIPFGASTGGANRWKAPQPAAAWTGTKMATKLGPICPQINPSSMVYDPTSDEDCLSLNVWTPDPAPTTPLPVMVWVFGGAFVFGNGGAAPYGGDHLVPKGVVVVTLNYRVGPLGFMTHRELVAEAQTTGNYGLLDQRLALQWVQANIAAFGGDKNNVTIFGESAGGKSTCLQLVSPGSQGLFKRAIVESGLCTVPGLTLTDAEAEGDRFATAMGCDADAGSSLACLRGLSADVVTKGPAGTTMQPGGLFYQSDASSYSFQPIVDGQFLTDQPATLFANKKAGNVVVLQGANTAEGVLFHSGVFGDTPVMSEADYEAALTRRFGTSEPMVLAQYPAASYASPNDALTQVTADSFFVCPARKLARLLDAAGNKNFLYSFNGTLSATPVAALAGKAFHSSELPYVFGDGYLLGSIPDGGAPLVDAIEGYWTRFAVTGDPNGGSAPTWPAYTTAGDQYLTLDTTIAAGTGLEKAKCDFWDSIALAGL